MFKYEVPMIWHFSGDIGKKKDDASALINIIKSRLNAARGEDRLRSRHFKDILLGTIQELKANTF